VTRLLLTVAIALLRIAGVMCYQRYRATRRDELRQLALVCFYAETRVRIERDRMTARTQRSPRS
jgi:hypothetical protein